MGAGWAFPHPGVLNSAALGPHPSPGDLRCRALAGSVRLGPSSCSSDSQQVQAVSAQTVHPACGLGASSLSAGDPGPQATGL